MKKIFILLLMVTMSFTVNRQAAADAPDLAKGDRAPDFDLIDESGKSVKLSDFRRQRRVILVFSRAHW
jgi:peroxiredoxin